MNSIIRYKRYMTTIAKFSIMLIFIIIISCSSDTQPTKSNEDDKKEEEIEYEYNAYFPIEVGNEWVLRTKEVRTYNPNDSTLSHIVVEKVEIYDGLPCFHLRTTDYLLGENRSGFKYPYTYVGKFLVADKDCYKILGKDQFNYTIVAENIYFKDTVIEKGSFPFDFLYEFKEMNPPLKTKIGEFEKVFLRVNNVEGIHIYFAENIGIVSTKFSSEPESILEYCRIGKKEYGKKPSEL